MQERRALHRNRTYIGARIVFNLRYSTMDCLVRNLSEDGAKLIFGGVETIPSEFDIFIRNQSDSRRAKMIWRTESEAGIRFISPGYNQIVSIEMARKVRQLEAEREKLAKRVEQLVDPA